jgi:hypothetical protein
MPPGKAKATPTMTPAAIWKFVKDSIAKALEFERAEVAARAAEAALQTGMGKGNDSDGEYGKDCDNCNIIRL